jgi:hypothetical protein
LTLNRNNWHNLTKAPISWDLGAFFRV